MLRHWRTIVLSTVAAGNPALTATDGTVSVRFDSATVGQSWGGGQSGWPVCLSVSDRYGPVRRDASRRAVLRLGVACGEAIRARGAARRLGGGFAQIGRAQSEPWPTKASARRWRPCRTPMSARTARKRALAGSQFGGRADYAQHRGARPLDESPEPHR
jgi:hypothetical protein